MQSEPIVSNVRLGLLNGNHCNVLAILPSKRKAYSKIELIAETLLDSDGELIFSDARSVLENLPPSLIVQASNQISALIQGASPSISALSGKEFEEMEAWIKAELRKMPIESYKLATAEKAQDYFGKGLIELNDIQTWTWHLELMRKRDNEKDRHSSRARKES